MALRYACDGCGALFEKPNLRGMVRIAHYCDTCVAEVDKYLEERSQIHTEVATAFQGRLEELRTRYHATIAKLPDDNA